MSFRVTRARERLAELDAKCKAAFRAGSDFHPCREGDAQHSYSLAMEYHRLFREREDARLRLARLEAQEAPTPANDTTRPAAGER